MVQPQQTHRPPQRSVLEAYVSVTGATYSAKAGDRVIGVNRAGAVTVTLPTAQLRKGRVYTVKDESGAAATNNITVATAGSETIDGSATDVINVNYESKSYYSNGTNWFILPVTPDTNTQNTYEAPGLTLGTSNVEGTGNSIRSGATVLAFDATNPSTQAHGGAAAVGVATVAARRDHKHAMPAAATAPIFARVVRSAGDVTTTSTTLVDFTGATVTFTTGAFPVAVGFAGSENNSSGLYNTFNIDVDGSLELGTGGIFASTTSAGYSNPSFTIQTAALTAASHTIKMQWKVAGGTGTVYSTGGNDTMFWAHEIR